MIKNIFFDFNGTLLDDIKLCFDLENELLDKYHLKRQTLDFYLNNFAFPVKAYYELIGFDFTKYSYDEVAQYFIKNYTLRQDKETFLYEGVKEALKKFKDMGIKLYILSASERNLLIHQLKLLGIYEYFDGFSACSDIHAKGKLEYGKEFILDNKIDVNETIYIGDTNHDYEVGTSLGMKTLLYTKGHNSKERLKELGAPLINSFEELVSYVQNEK